jgi:hypothetical protein
MLREVTSHKSQATSHYCRAKIEGTRHLEESPDVFVFKTRQKNPNVKRSASY